MLYILSIIETPNNETMAYTVFETSTESYFKAYTDTIMELVIRHKLNLKNMKLVGGKIVPEQFCKIHKECRDATIGPPYTLLCQVDSDTFKLAFYTEDAIYVSGEKLKELIASNAVGNCILQDGTYKSTGTYSVDYSTPFKKYIAEKYKIYVAKSALLGRNMTFEYIVEGREVKLTKYTGTANDVIVPKFITSIMTRAFKNSGITKLVLDDGLKSIGAFSFAHCDIAELVIPKTVEIICGGAFYKNKELVRNIGEYTHKIKVLNKRTVIL